MRTFIDGTGADSTSAALAYFASHGHRTPADLYVIFTAPNYAGQFMGRTFLLTDHPSSLTWSYRGLFSTGTISRGEVQSKIGLDIDTLEIIWSPSDSDVLAADDFGAPLLTAIQGFSRGVFDNGTVEVWRTQMPTEGDCDTLGAALLFSGRIGNIETDRLKAKIQVIGRLETLNEMVPTNLIEPTNILSFYTTGQVLKDGPSTFALVGGSTDSVLVADPTDAPGGYAGTSDAWDDGYIVMLAGAKTGGTYRAIRQQVFDGTHHVFYLYEPLPFAPEATDTFNAFILVPPDQAGALAQGSEFDGFPYVPSALQSSVVIS